MLITLITAEQFELPLIIGLPAKINVFSYRIYFELNPLSSLPNYGGAAALSLPFVVLGVLLLLLYNRLIRRADSFVTVTGKGFRQRRLPLGAWKVPALALVSLYIALAAVLPAAVLLWTSLFGYTLPTSATAADFSLEAYRALFANRAFWLGLRNTFLVALVSALIVTAIGMLLGWIISRSQLRIRHALDFVSVLSVGIPAVIAGPRRDAALSVAADRTLRNGLDSGHRLLLPLRHHYAAGARRLPADPQGAGGGFGRVGRALAGDAAARAGAADAAGACPPASFCCSSSGCASSPSRSCSTARTTSCSPCCCGSCSSPVSRCPRPRSHRSSSSSSLPVIFVAPRVFARGTLAEHSCSR